MIGRSTGSPSELAIRTAMDAAFDRIARDPRVDRTRIFRFGQSLGDYFDNLGALAHFSGPVLVIHGRQDQLVPWEQGRGLALASAHSVFRLYDCGHGCWDPDRLPFWKDAEPFLLNAGILLHPHAGS
jgi:pimeloyl-ACP methyl ester carboxylesterase